MSTGQLTRTESAAGAVPSLAMLFAPPGVTAGEIIGRLGQMLTDPFDLRIIGRTVGLGLVVTVICVALGFPVAYLLARSTSRLPSRSLMVSRLSCSALPLATCSS